MFTGDIVVFTGDIAAATGRCCVAEGVETAARVRVLLRGLGVQGYQGWLFARLLPTREFRAQLAGGRLPAPIDRG